MLYQQTIITHAHGRVLKNWIYSNLLNANHNWWWGCLLCVVGNVPCCCRLLVACHWLRVAQLPCVALFRSELLICPQWATTPLATAQHFSSCHSLQLTSPLAVIYLPQTEPCKNWLNIWHVPSNWTDSSMVGCPCHHSENTLTLSIHT